MILKTVIEATSERRSGAQLHVNHVRTLAVNSTLHVNHVRTLAANSMNIIYASLQGPH